jgi:hypothetical protein
MLPSNDKIKASNFKYSRREQKNDGVVVDLFIPKDRRYQ